MPQDSRGSSSQHLTLHSSYAGEIPNLKNVINVMVWHQCMRCWKPKGEASIFKDVTKLIYV